MTDQYKITAQQLRLFISRYEALEEEKASFAWMQKDLLSEAKGAGYDTSVIKEIIKLRKMKPEDRAEKEAILQVYLEALEID